MQPFRGPPPRGFPGAMPPPIAGMGGPPSHMRPPPMAVGGGVMPPRGAMMPPPRGGPMMFAPPPMGPRGMALPPPGMGPGPRGTMLFSAHGMPAGPPGVSNNSAPPPPGTVDIPVPVVELPNTEPMNVFVGKLPPDLHDNFIRQLLEKCGTVVTWKRTADPVTGKPKGFGYCTFSAANDVLRALRLLNGFAVDSREILLKVDSKTQTKLDVVTNAMTEKMKLEEQERDNKIKQSLKNLCQVRSGRMGGQQNDVATWGELLEKKTADEQDQQQRNGQQAIDNGDAAGGGSAVGEQENPDSGDQRGETRSASSDAPVEGEKIRGSMIMREVEKFRLAQEQREQEQEQKRREAVLERLRREKEDEEKRRAADERRRAADERRRATEEKRKAEEDAARIAKAEAAAARTKYRENGGDEGNGDYDSETDEREDGGRRKSSSSRRREREDRERDRKKRSTRERSRNRDHDRKRGRDHRSHSHSRSRERSSRRRRHRKSHSHSRSRTRSRSRHRGDRERDRETRRKRRHRRDSSDHGRSDDEERKRSSKRKRDSTKVKAADGDNDRATERDERHNDETGNSPSKVENSSSQSPPPPQSETAAVETPKPIVMPKVVLGLKMTSATIKKDKPVAIPAVSAFVVEEEVEAKPLRELVPIDYTEEEKLAGASVQQRVAATVARINSRSGDVKSLIDQIPTETAELFAYPIDWQAVDQHKIVQEKMEPWVKKKIVEYLGEDEPTLTEFLLKKLDQRAQAQEILNELQLVLDEDAEVFVKLLWRKLAFEAIRVSSQ